MSSEAAGGHLRVESRGWRGGGGKGAACAPGTAAAVVVGRRVVAIGREASPRAGEESGAHDSNVGGFAMCAYE